MPLDNKTQQIYTTLQRGGADVGTEQEFNDYFFAKGDQGYKNRLEVWKALKGGGADVGKNYEEFRDWLGLRATSKPAAPRLAAAPTQPRQAAVAQERRQQQKQRRTMTDAEKAAALATPATSSKGSMGQRIYNAAQTTLKPWTEPNPQALSDERKAELMAGASDIIDSGEQTAAAFDERQQNREEYLKQHPLTQNVAKRKRLNMETGKMEDTYLTSAGSEYNSEYEAQREQRLLNDEAYRRAHPLEAAQRDVTQDLRDIRTEEEKVTEARRASEKAPEDKTWWDFFKEGFAPSAISGVNTMGSLVDTGKIEADMERLGAYGADRKETRETLDVLRARRSLAEETRAFLDDVQKDINASYGVFGGLKRATGKALSTATDFNTWDFGEGELNDALAIAHAVIKDSEGIALNHNERALLDSWAKNAALNSQYGDEVSGWTKAGMVTGEMAPFMLEMALNPASGLGEAATKRLVQYSTKRAVARFLEEGIKKFGEKEGMKWARVQAEKWVASHAKSMLAKRIATRVMGDVIGAGVMATTTGQARVAADYERRVTGNVDIGLDDNGDIVYKGVTDKESPGAAIFKALSSTAIDNWSEMAGNYLGFLNSFFGRTLGKAVIGKAGRKALQVTGNLEGVGLNKAQRFIYDLAAGKGIGAFSEALGQFAKRTQWQGVTNEYLEEVMGNIANAAIVGDMTFDAQKGTGVFNLEQNIDTFCGVALFGGFMSSLHTIGYAAHKVNYDVDRVSKANSKLFGDELWDGIKTMIDNSHSDSRELNAALTYFLRGDSGKQYSKEEKEAILKYTQAVLEKEGSEMAHYQPRMASSTREEGTGEDGTKQWTVTSLDSNGDAISQQSFNTEDEAIAYEGELNMRQQQRDYKEALNMSGKLSFGEATAAIDEFLGERGITEETEGYAEAAAELNDPNSELGKQFQQFKQEKMVEKGKASQAAIAQFEEDHGWEAGTVKWLSEQDPMELDSESLQMADEARAFLETLAYPPTEVHVEHEKQKGAEVGKAVVEQVVSPDAAIDPADNAGQQMVAELDAARQAYDELMKRNEELAQEVNSRLAMGMSEQEVVSSLDTFRPEDVQTVIDYFNANARYNGFMEEASKQIDAVVSRNTSRRTFRGTINGAADVSNLYTVTDESGNSYTLVSGNVSTDADGRVTDSDSGLVIGVDAEGNFVQLGDKNLTLQASGMTVEQYAEGERARLEEAVTGAIDAGGALREQGGNADVEAGAKDTGGDEAPATTPAAEGAAEEPAEEPTGGPAGGPAGEAAGTGATGKATIESVTDKDGIKRYENGIDIDEAITDIVNDGLDVDEVADASIAEAQEIIDKINSKERKTRKDLVERRKAQDVIDYYNSLKERYADANAEEPQEATVEPEGEPSGTVAGTTGQPIQPEQPVEEAPEWRYDTPEAARKRGYKVIEGHRIDRQEEKPMPQGKEVEVQYSTKDKVKGHLTVSELDDVQGSHLTNGQRNEKHFMPEVQPKAEFGADRQTAAQTNASEENFRPELTLTFNDTQSAYTGSASQTNRRKEIIQGHGRRNLAEYIYAPGNEAVARIYKDYLKAHAAELGTTAEAIEQMEKPFAHIVLDVSDEEAIRLGQFTAQDLETGGKKVPEVTTTITKLGDSYGSFANIVLENADPDASLAERIEGNAERAIKWLNQGGYINDTEAKTLLEDKSLARQFVKDMITDTLFRGASPELRSMFYELPKNIQSAIVSVVGREVMMNQDTTILKDVQESILAYHELMSSSSAFAKAKGRTFEERYNAVTSAVNDWLRQLNIDGSVNSKKFSNFALELAKRYKSYTDQKTLRNQLQEYYDLVSGAPRQLTMFEEAPTRERLSRDAAIKKVFGINEKENGEQGVVPLAGDNTGGQEGGQGQPGDTGSGEQEPEGEQPPVGGRGDTGDAGIKPLGKPKGTGAQSRKDYLASHPLTEAQIMADTEATEDEKLNAIDFLRGEDDSAISRFYYDSIYERTQKTKPTERKGKKKSALDDYLNDMGMVTGLAPEKENEEKPNESNAEDTADPMAAVERAAQSFREEQKAKDQQDIDNALDEFNKFLDDAKGSNVLDKFMRKGLEGNDKAQTNLLDAFTLTNEAQRMFLKDLLRLASKVGYAYIKSGVHNVHDWNTKMWASVGKKLKEVLGWDDYIVSEFVDEVWNQKYTVDGVRMRLSEHAERLKGSSAKYNKGDVVTFWNSTHTSKLQGTITAVRQTESFGAEYDVASKLSTDNGPGRGVTTRDHVYTILEGQIVSRDAKGADTAVNVNKKENNEAEKPLSLQEETAGKPAGTVANLEGDSAEFAERQEKIDTLRADIRRELKTLVMNGGKPHPMSFYKELAERGGVSNLSNTDLQELVEAEVVAYARELASEKGKTDKQKYDQIVMLYQMQPSLNARDNDRINLQQYSTPAPMAFLMGLFAKPAVNGRTQWQGLEPSAGNGMLTINLPKERMHVNDIDEMRLSNLQKQGFGQVTSQDGTQPFEPKAYDVVVTNPPFGNVTPKVYDGLYEISGLEHQMAINALESMKDDGRAAIIIGGNTEYNTNGTIKGKDRVFLNYLYSHYNVVDVINMDGKTLYSRQGTGYPVRMILINGRKEFDKNSFAPVQSKARAEVVRSYDELYKRVEDDILSNENKPAGVHDTEGGESGRVDDSGNAGTSTQTGVRNVRTEGSVQQPNVLDTNGQPVPGRSSTTGGTNVEGRPVVGGTDNVVLGAGTETTQPSGSATPQANGGRGIPERRDDSKRPDGGLEQPVGVGQRGTGTSQPIQQPEQKRGLGTEKVPYRKQSGNPFTLQSLMPAEQADVVKKSLEELGDVDQFLVDELGYANKEELHRALAAEQIDSVAMAIHQMNQGNAFIIGDMTGIGKGRQAAALIRYGVKKGGCPVFITVKKSLFSDMYRDLCDIGSPGLRPFIWAADDKDHSANVTDENNKLVYELPSKKEQKRVVEYINKNGKLPPEYDYVLTTYDPFKSGTIDYENGQKKARNFGRGKSAGSMAINGQAKRDALEALARNSYVIMDESHNAGGEDSNISNYLQYITTRAKGITFLSATFAKRPGNMPIYSLKTAISKAGVAIGELIDAVKRGGATFQEIMSKALTEAGQMIRRERDMTGVTIDWKGIEDEAVIQKQREQYDNIVGLFNDIIDFQRTYVDPIVNGLNDAAADVQGAVDHTPGTRDMGINNTPFASRTYNMVQQVLLSLKAEEAAKRAIDHLKHGRKAVITVANTNEGAADEAAGLSDEDMEMPDLSVNLKKGLRGTLRITEKDAFGNQVNREIPFDSLSPEGQARYREIMDAIDKASTGLSLSPIDVIKNELKKAGYKVGELTGRTAEFVYNEDGTVKRVKREDTDKKQVAADFNNGKIDALILNKSAGTGISLHASTKFKDQRQRVMIVAQAQGDVNDEVQIRGRIDRTGQVLRGMYEYVVSQIPSEQRLLMMLKAKLRSLDANTTSSQKSKFNEMQVQDIINKYGDQIVAQYLAEHPDLYAMMADPFGWGEKVYEEPVDTLVKNIKPSLKSEAGKIASTALGRMALLKVKDQEQMLKDIGELYQAEIDRLNEMGENDLEITEMPLKAKTLSKDVWEQGTEPGGKNPFADNSYVERVQMDVLKKPMKGDEVKGSQERLLGGKTWEDFKKETMAKVDEWAEQKKKETTETITARAKKKAEAERDKYIKGAKKAQEKNQMTDEQIEHNGQLQYNHVYDEEMKKLENAIDGIESQREVFEVALDTFSTDGVYAIPMNIYDLGSMTFEPGFGKLIDVKISSNFSPNSSTLTFATLDGRRKITVPINGKVKQQNNEKRDLFPVITTLTAQTRNGMFGSNVSNTLKVLSQDINNWDRLTSTAARKEGYIITGNLLKALVSTREQGVGGKLISFTTDTGEVRQGILMPDNFDPSGLTSKTPISSKKEDLRYYRGKVESADGDVTVRVTNEYDWRDNGYNTLELVVPGSNKRGSKYFNDKVLLSLMNGQFEGKTKMKAEFKRENLDAVMSRLDELGVTVKEEKPAGNAAGTGRRYDMDIEEGEGVSEPQQQTERSERIAEHVDGLVEKLGTKGRTTVYHSFDELPEKDRAFVRNAERQGKKVRGWYENGRVFLYLPHIDSIYQAEKTIWHETVAHHGLRQLIGEENLNKLLTHLWLTHKDGDMGKWVTERMTRNGWSLNEAIEEYLAREAEKHPFEQPSLWQRVRWMVADALRKIGFKSDPTISDIQYLLWLNQNRLNDNDPLMKMKQQAFVHRLERAAALQPHTQQEEDSRRKTDGHGGRLFDMDIDEPVGEGIKRVYEETMDTKAYVFTEAFQDAMLALKVFMNSALKKGEQVLDSQNAYMAENLMHGKSKNEMDLFNEEHRKGIERVVNEILNKMGWGMREMNIYLMTKSGLERNRELYVRDWLERERRKKIRKYEDLRAAERALYDAKEQQITQDFDDGLIDEEEKNKRLAQALIDAHDEFIDSIENDWHTAKDDAYADLLLDKTNYAEYLDALATFIKKNINARYEPSKHDYSGLTEMYGDADGKYDEKDIIDQLMEDETAMNDSPDGDIVDVTYVLWSRIGDANKYALERYREAGMRTDEQIDKIEQMFHFYVPMRGFDKDMGEDVYQYFTSKTHANSYVGGLIKHAKGRRSMANSPLSTMFAMAYKAISDCNQNRVKQHFYRFCQAHPNDLIVMDDAWVKLNEITGEWEEVWPDIPEDATDDQVREAVKAFDDEMRQLASEDKAKKINGKGSFDYKPIDKKHKDEHTIEVMINGKKKLMTVVGNPRVAQAINGHTRWENGKNIISKINAYIKNKMSSAFTSYSPTFAMRNMLRDWTHFAMMLNTREGAGYTKAALNYYRETLPRPFHGKKRHGADKGKRKIGMKELFKKYRNDTLDMSHEVERDFKDFMDNGGVTGYVHMQKVDKLEKEIQKLVGDPTTSDRIVDKLRLRKAVEWNNKLWNAILGIVEAYNEAVENNARFATYRASRHYAGRTKARSAYDAKEITVNFNRKGSGSKVYGFKSDKNDVNLAAQTAGVTSQVLGEGKIFFNATIQAIANTFKGFKNPDGTLNKKYIAKWAGKYALPPFAFGLLLPYINQALFAMIGGDDDDPYANLPEWTRRKNLCFYVGNNNFVTIPVGQELAAFLALGDIVAANLYAPDLKPVDKDWVDEMEGVMNTFSPIDIDTKITKGGLLENPMSETVGRLSSVLAPVIAVEQNLSWTGRPIYKEDRFTDDEFNPEYQMVYQSTNPLLVATSKYLHELGGGNDRARGKEWSEVNPAIVQYLWEQYTGGPGKVFANTISMGKDAKDLIDQVANEKPIDTDFNMRKVEGPKAFFQQGDDRTQFYRVQAKFFKYQHDADKFKHDHDLSTLEKNAKKDPFAKLELEKLEKTAGYQRYKILKEANRSNKKEHKVGMDELRKEINNTTDRAEKRDKQRVYNYQMEGIVDLLDKVPE